MSVECGGCTITCIHEAGVVGVEGDARRLRKASRKSLRQQQVTHILFTLFFAMLGGNTNFRHKDLAELRATVGHPTIIRLRAFVFEVRIVNCLWVAHVSTGGEG